MHGYGSRDQTQSLVHPKHMSYHIATPLAPIFTLDLYESHGFQFVKITKMFTKLLLISL